MNTRQFMAFVAILILLMFMAQTIVALSAFGGVGVYFISPHFVFSIFVILVIYMLAWRK